MSSPTLNERLGYPAEARLLIINADDFGMCHAENAATMEGLAAGAYTSSTMMVPCPWFEEAAAFARAHPQVDVGVHLTHTSEWATYKWGPVTGRGAVPSLCDEHGHFFAELEAVYGSARLEHVERETRAQIERALAAGIDITHLDSHVGTLQLEVSYHALYVRLAAEYRLPIRMMHRGWMGDMGMSEIVKQAEQVGVLAPDYLHVGGPPRPGDTAGYWTDVFRRLRSGVNEIYIHAAHDHPELRAIYPEWEQRVADHRFCSAAGTRALLRDLGIELINYRALREAQRQNAH